MSQTNVREPARFQCSSASRKFGKARQPLHMHAALAFQCSSASRKFGKNTCHASSKMMHDVSVLFCEPKIRKMGERQVAHRRSGVSVLFCEPKIRKSETTGEGDGIPLIGFSALLRAENSEKCTALHAIARACGFQCSSASRKFGKTLSFPSRATSSPRFSALLRAENSEKLLEQAYKRAHAYVSVLFCEPKIRKIGQRYEVPSSLMFQCSSASRKFGKQVRAALLEQAYKRFSALLRAENSENLFLPITST